MDLYLDTESVGLFGPTKLIQSAINEDGPITFIKLFSGWNSDYLGGSRTRLELTILFRQLHNPDTLLIGWNLAHDLYHLYRVQKMLNGSTEPFECRTLDLLNHATFKGPFAAFAFSGRSKAGGGKKVAAVRKVPVAAAPYVEAAVTARLQPLIPGTVTCHRHEVPNRKDLITLSWSCDVSLSLKPHLKYWGEEVIKLAEVWPLPDKNAEKLWMDRYTDLEGNLVSPYLELEPKCDEILNDDKSSFYTYAALDVYGLRLARSKLDNPTPNSNDVAAHVIAYTRLAGFPVDRPTLDRTRDYYTQELARIEADLAGCNLKSSQERKALLQRYNPLIQSSKKAVLEELSKDTLQPVARVAASMLRFGSVKQKLDQVTKAGETLDGRLHADLRPWGTATNRCAGTGAFNVQGIGKVEEDGNGNKVGLRACVGAVAVGDYHQFELAIAASAWGDDNLLSDLSRGRDVHLNTAIACHPSLVPHKLTYDEALKAKKEASHPLHGLVVKCRDHCKRMVFGILYGCTAQKIMEVFGVDEPTAEQILQRFYALYPGLAKFKRGVEARFCTADTEHWNKGSVAQMGDSETDLTGFRRSWAFEKAVAGIMWELGNTGLRMPISGTVTRQQTKGPQPIAQAVRSAFLGAAISIQQAVFRQAANMRIQATGANLCKQLQAILWEQFRCPMLNVHDELVFAPHPNFDYGKVQAAVEKFVAEKKALVRYLQFDMKPTERWSDK